MPRLGFEDCGDYSDLVAEYNEQNRYRKNLARHPDCRDPDHPGCEICEPPEDEEE